MGFKNIWESVPESKKEEIFKEARGSTPFLAAKKYSEEIGLSEQSIVGHIKKHMRIAKIGKVSPRGNPKDSSSRDLTDHEQNFIQDLREGRKDAEDVSRYILANYMENVFRNPELIKSIDAFRAEMLKLKKQEQKDRQSQAMVLVSMMFNGQIPPAHCPRCGFQLYSIDSKSSLISADVVEGEVEDEQ